MLTHPDHSSTLWAKRMRLQAQGFEEVYNTKVWRTLAHGVTSCRGCASVTMDPVPEGAERYDVDVVLSAPDVDVGGFIYLFDVS